MQMTRTDLPVESGHSYRTSRLTAHCPATGTDESAVPSRVFLRVSRVIVPPGEKQQQSEERARNQGEERQGSRRHGRRIRLDDIDVKDQPTDTDKHQNGPSDDLQI